MRAFAFAASLGLSAPLSPDVTAAEAGEPSRTQVDTLQAIGTGLAALQDHIVRQEATYREELKQEKAKYDKQLEAKRREMFRMEMDNADVRKQVEDAQGVNTELLRKAKSLQDVIGVWHRDWLALRDKLSDATEVTSMAMKHDQRRASVPQLQVLRDLNQKDAESDAAEKHRRQVEEVLGGGSDTSIAPAAATKPAWLQVDKRLSRADGEEVVKALQDGIASLSREYEKKKDDLKLTYKQSFAEIEQRCAALAQERMDLKRYLVELQDVEKRLSAAVSHLEAVSRHLDERGRSIRAYAQKIGSQGLVSLAVPGAASIPAPGGGATPSATARHDEAPFAGGASHAQPAAGVSDTAGAGRSLRPSPGNSTLRGQSEPASLLAASDETFLANGAENSTRMQVEGGAVNLTTAAGSKPASWLGWLKR